MKKFLVRFLGSPEITEVNIIRETANMYESVSRNGGIRKEKKKGSWWAYFDTKEDAVAYIKNKLSIKIKNLEEQIKDLNRDLNKDY